MVSPNTPSWSPEIETAILAGQLITTMSLSAKVLALTAQIPRGQIATYGQIAQALGSRAYQAVGQALHRNPYAPTVPCHRVVGRDGSLTGFATGLAKKRSLLIDEGWQIKNNRLVQFTDRLATFQL